jgi:hypothetical protein
MHLCISIYKEEYNMYNDELDYALESAYEDGYYQALADMGYEFDDVEEDVDIFDEDCFDDAMEGNAANKEAKGRWENATGRSREDRFRTTTGGGYVVGMKHYNRRLDLDMQSGRHLTPNEKAVRARKVEAAKRYDRGRGAPISNRSRIDENTDRRLLEDPNRDNYDYAVRSGRIYR